MLESLTLDPDELESYRRTTWLVSFMPRDQLPASEWMTRNFKHGANLEAPDFDRFPWLREPADCITDYRVEEQLFLAPPQVGKSLVAEGSICFFIVEDPADIVAYTHTIELAKDWGEKRIMPEIRGCPACRPFLPQDPKAMRKTELLMPHMVLEVEPANETQTQSRSRRIVICDERWLWEAGRYDNAKRRASSPNFEGRKKILSYSNSGIYESDVESQWRTSDQRILVSDCPTCGKWAPFKFSEKRCRRVPANFPAFTIRFDENATTRPNGVWDLDEVVKTIRLVCPNCSAAFEDTPKVRVALRRKMRYEVFNPRASMKSRAWAVSGVAVYPWEDLVKQFINAMQQLDLGDPAALKEFILKGLNEPWSDDVIFDQTSNPSGDYEMTGEPWAEATCAAMTIDVQELAPYFWFVIRDWADNGRSRLRRCGYAHTWDEVKDISEKENLPARFVHCDVTYKPDEVYQHCARWGWIAFRGRPEDFFTHRVEDPNGTVRSIRRYFSERRLVDPAIGTDQQSGPNSTRRSRAIEFMWADTPVKDVLFRLFGGKGVYFGVPKDAPQYYLNHMSSERKIVAETRGNREIRRWKQVGKRPNHLWDCEAMQIVFALIKGPLRLATDQPAGE